MRHKITRIVVGLVFLASGVVNFIRNEWWMGFAFSIVAVVFLVNVLRGNSNKEAAR